MNHLGEIIRNPTPEHARDALEYAVPTEVQGVIGLNNTDSAMDYIFDTTESLLTEASIMIKDVYYDRIVEMITNIMGGIFT